MTIAVGTSPLTSAKIPRMSAAIDTCTQLAKRVPWDYGEA